MIMSNELPGLTDTFGQTLPVNNGLQPSFQQVLDLQPEHIINSDVALEQALPFQFVEQFLLACLVREQFSGGLPETATSGLANGALAAFLVKNGFAQPGTVIIEQGESLDRTGRVEVKVKATEEEIKSVKIGGKARVIFSLNLVDSL